jgi:hypothetical protein
MMPMCTNIVLLGQTMDAPFHNTHIYIWHCLTGRRLSTKTVVKSFLLLHCCWLSRPSICSPSSLHRIVSWMVVWHWDWDAPEKSQCDPIVRPPWLHEAARWCYTTTDTKNTRMFGWEPRSATPQPGVIVAATCCPQRRERRVAGQQE